MSAKPSAHFMRFLRGFALYCAGGMSYGLIETAWRGSTHISMFFVGGLCFLVIGMLDEFEYKPCLMLQMPICAALITSVELCSGLFINMALGLNVWDYSQLPLNLLGQICLPFSVLWLALSLPAIYLDDTLRHFLFGQPMKRLHVFPLLPSRHSLNAVTAVKQKSAG